MSLWQEIKQRRITQIVVAYLAGGWMVLAVVDQVVDREVLPPVVYQVSLTLYLFGIAAALVVGWYHGEKGAQRAPMSEIVALGVLVVACTATSVQVIRSALNQATLANALSDAGADLTRIAILYFEDMSSDGSMGPVADGITEGLISTLARVPELEVTSISGAQRARDLDATPDSIARFLDVGTLVDGTVNEVGDELRVSVRVLEGASGIPLFRDSYAWPADQVAAVSDRLADEVANALREQLGQEIQLRRGRAQAPNAASWLQVARAERLIKDARAASARGDVAGAADALDGAETELTEARESAPEWAEPLVQLGQVAYDRYAVAGNRDELLATLDEAVDDASQALQLEPDNPDALELRGTARYRGWLTRDEEVNDEFQEARDDLEQSFALDRTRASAKATLSHLYMQVSDWPQAVLAAREAYTLDAFLSSAADVLWRLTTASYDMGEYAEANRWCSEGSKRFPDNYRFVQCQILVMTMSAAEPDVDHAWELHEKLLGLLGEGGEFLDAQSQIMIAGIVGRAGLADSANAVIARARRGPDVDPEGELLVNEAAMRSVSGDVEGAVRVLERFLAAHPGHFPGRHWWWTNLETDPTFRRLRDAH